MNQIKSKKQQMMNSTMLTNESGRSMVEMLGVLAVIGVLSVAGIAGYTSAMNKHRANELLNAIAMRTVVLAAQRAQGVQQLSLSEFGNAKVGTSTISVDTNNANAIVLTLTDVPAAVCKNMYNTKGANVVAMTSNGTTLSGADGCVDGPVTVTFNNDLETGTGTGDNTNNTPSLANTIGDILNGGEKYECNSDCPWGFTELGEMSGEYSGHFAAICETTPCSQSQVEQIQDILHSKGDSRNCITFYPNIIACHNNY